jgi:hypothetical protein
VVQGRQCSSGDSVAVVTVVVTVVTVWHGRQWRSGDISCDSGDRGDMQ